jgi:hypothetical protein
MKKETTGKLVIAPINLAITSFLVIGTAPLVVERFNKKAEIMERMATDKKSAKKPDRKPRDYAQEVHDAKYISREGWEGVNAAAFRSAMISACRLVGFKMTIAKLSIFIEQDGFDVADGLPIVRIYGESFEFSAHTRNATGVIDIRARPQYREWACVLRIKYDADQFSATDVINLLTRVGAQVGIGAGRPDSKSSAGCGWGTFEVIQEGEKREAMEKLYGIVRK